MKWFWYRSEENEIFCDLDSRERLFYALQRLRRALVQGVLDVESVWLYPSVTVDKFHLIIRLKDDDRPADARVRWAMYLGSDTVRGLYTLERIKRGLQWPDLLIAAQEYYRPADAMCDCPEKHKAKRITANCPVMQAHHGEEAGAVYFAKNLDRKPRKKLGVPLGRIPLTVLRGL